MCVGYDKFKWFYVWNITLATIDNPSVTDLLLQNMNQGYPKCTPNLKGILKEISKNSNMLQTMCSIVLYNNVK